jgi:exonuclease III
VELNPGFSPHNSQTNIYINDSKASNYYNSKGMKILHFNASLSPKIDEIQLLINELKPELFCVCETWLNEDIHEKEVELTEHKVIRKNRTNSRGGGVAIYIKLYRNFEFEVLHHMSDVECITLKIQFKNKKAFYVSCVYIPHNSQISVNDWNSFLNIFQCPIGSEHIILGDLNIDLLKNDNKDWTNCMKACGYKQLIKTATRVTNQTASLIDHIYVSTKENISNYGNIDIPLSDHQLIFVSRKLNFKIKSTKKS